MGFLFSFLSAVFGSAKDLVSKKVAFSLDGTVSTFASFVFALPFYQVLLLGLWILGYEDLHISPGFLLLVLLRSLTDAVGEWCKMSSFSYGDISLVAPLQSLSPLFLLFLGPLIAGDTFTYQGCLGVLLIAAGTVLSTYRRRVGGEPAHQGRAILLALGFSLFAALNTCFDRLAVHQASPTLSGFLMTLLAAVPFVPSILRSPERRTSLQLHWQLLTLRGALEISFMVTKLYALKYVETAYVVAIQRLSLLISIVGGKVLFAEREFRRRLAAGILMLFGVVLIVWQ